MHLGDKLKLYRRGKDLDQFQMAEILQISHRKYQDIEKTGVVQKVGDYQKIKNILGEPTQINAQIEEKKQVHPDVAMDIIANLTESNRMLAEANLILANKINSGGLSSTSSSSKMKGKVSTDPTEEMQPGIQEKSSEGKRKRKDSVQH